MIVKGLNVYRGSNLEHGNVSVAPSSKRRNRRRNTDVACALRLHCDSRSERRRLGRSPGYRLTPRPSGVDTTAHRLTSGCTLTRATAQ
ncbi:unnamed protein product, partial [Iphiclides podalirius]